MAKAKITIEHDTIRRWAEARDGHPARVKGAGTKKNGRAEGLLRIDFSEPESALETISWEEFFDTFEGNNLAFIYQEEMDGKKSRFFKFTDRAEVADQLEAGEAEEEDNEKEKEEEETALADEEEEDEDDDEDEEGVG